MDFEILYALNGMHNDVLDVIMKALTFIAENGILFIIIAAIMLFNSKTRKCGFYILVSLGLGFLIGNCLIKNWVARPRPCWIDTSIPLLVPNLADYSFPSGHTMAAFEFAVTIFLFNKKWGIPAIIIACLVGLSRMYLFVHFPTDVIAGAIFGTLFAVCTFYIGNAIINRIKENKKPKKTKI